MDYKELAMLGDRYSQKIAIEREELIPCGTCGCSDIKIRTIWDFI